MTALADLPQVPTEPDLSPHDAARLSGVSYWTILRQIKTGKLRAFRRPGNQLAILHSDYRAWAYGRPVVPDQPAPSADTAPRRARRPAARGSLASLDDIERRASA